MANTYLIRISIYPYIRKYLLYHYSEPFFVSDRGYIPCLVENMLERPTKVDPANYKKKDKVNYGAFIGAYVGTGIARKHGNTLSSDNVVRFNEVVADMIHEEMYRFIIQMANSGCQVDDSIRGFQAIYDFTEDELPFENLKRWYYRERKRITDRRTEQRAIKPQFELNFFEELSKEQPAGNGFGAQMALLNFAG